MRKLAGVLGIRYRELADGEFNHTSALVLLDAEGRVLARTEKLGASPGPGVRRESAGYARERADAGKSVPGGGSEPRPEPQGHERAGGEAGQVRPPGHRAEGRADEGEHQLQAGPQPDQQRRRRAQNSSHSPSGTTMPSFAFGNSTRYAPIRADMPPLAPMIARPVADQQRGDEVASAPPTRNSQQPPGAEAALGGHAEDQQEDAVADQVQPGWRG